MRRFTLPALALAAVGLSGCVEGEQTFTLNPDGSGKLRIDVVMVVPPEIMGGPPKTERPTPEEMRQQGLRVMMKAPGIAAWKDVAAVFTPDGRLKFGGTAYFDQLGGMEFQNGAIHLGSPFALTPGPGGLVLAKKAPKRGGGPPTPEAEGPFSGPGRKTPAELAKLTDAALDDYILVDRVQYQGARSLMLAVYSRAKVKTTYVLPAAAKDVVGFKADGAKLVHTLDGEKVAAAFDAFFARPPAELRAAYRKAGALEEIVAGALGSLPPEACKATVAAGGAAQFDYGAEVKAARAAYPALRKALGVADDFWIPDGNPPPPPKGFPPPPPR